jgi:hypothetical protein
MGTWFRLENQEWLKRNKGNNRIKLEKKRRKIKKIKMMTMMIVIAIKVMEEEIMVTMI